MTEIAKEYGTALFLLAAEEDREQDYADALDRVCDAFSQSPDYLELLKSPAIPPAERQSAILAVFGRCLPTHVLSYLQLICEKGRMDCFMEAAEEYRALLSASMHCSRAKITTAAPLDEEQKAKLVDALERKYQRKIQADYYTDPALLGGAVVEMDGHVLDGSLKHRLREVKEVMMS